MIGKESNESSSKIYLNRTKKKQKTIDTSIEHMNIIEFLVTDRADNISVESCTSINVRDFRFSDYG